MRIMVARTVAQSITPAVEAATSPFQYAPATKSGAECVAHAIQSLTDLDSRATVLSIDGISAFDLISRAAMLDGVSTVEGGDSVLPFVLQFHSEPSKYLVRRLRRHSHYPPGRDALMPKLYALGQHGVLESIQESLLPREHLFAYLDDLYVVWSP